MASGEASGGREGKAATGAYAVYLAKGSRVYVSGLLSVMLPAYLKLLGYSPFFVGVALTAILLGGALSNVALTYYDAVFGRRRLLLAFSLLMALSGIMLAASESAGLIILACLLGNISTTGTEAGPFQSVEAGVLPDIVGGSNVVRTFGLYNLVGYSASALGTFTLYLPGASGNDLGVFRALFVVFGLVGVLLFFLYRRLEGVDVHTGGTRDLSKLGKGARSEIKALSALFGLDAFGGSFVSQYLLSYWFNLEFGVPTTELAVIFLVSNVISAASTYGAAFLAERLGNLRTMVSTHVISSLFLLGVALSGALPIAIGFLFLRQAFSQMDVPTRQALMAEMFLREERVPAYAITNTVRSGGSAIGGPVSAVLLGSGAVVGIIYLGGVSKLAYDVLVLLRYRSRYR